jgi:hypothetical protein
MEFPTLSVVRPAHQANQSATAAEVTDLLGNARSPDTIIKCRD